MLAKGKGYITIEKFREIFNLPTDAEIIDIDIDMYRGIIQFSMLSADEVEKKFFKVKDIDEIHRFRLVEEKIKSFEEVMSEVDRLGFVERIMQSFYDDWEKHWEEYVNRSKDELAVDNEDNEDNEDNSNENSSDSETGFLFAYGGIGDNVRFKIRENFGFDEAMKALLDGKKVSRSIWSGYWEIRETTEFGNVIVAVLKDGGIAVAQPYMEDLMAFDWQIVE